MIFPNLATLKLIQDEQVRKDNLKEVQKPMNCNLPIVTGGNPVDTSQILSLISKLKSQLEDIQRPFNENDRKTKEENRAKKQARDYQIFDGMPYKFNTKTYSLIEKHPISKERVVNASKLVNELSK